MAQPTTTLACPLELIVRSGKGLHCPQTQLATEAKNSNIAQMVDGMTSLPLPVNLIGCMVVAVKADAEILLNGWLSR